MYDVSSVRYTNNNMPKKRITWIGSILILAIGAFSFWTLFQSRSHFLASGTRFHLATVGTFLAPVITVTAIYLWYYFNEKQ
jgi:hypothetical protein